MYCRNCGHTMTSTVAECPNCGSRNGGGTNYCQECGAPSNTASCLCSRCGCELRATLMDGSRPIASFSEAVKRCFKRYASWRGRANRVEFWMWWLFVLIATAFVVVGWLMIPVLIIPTISVTIRRLHDIGKSGWWILLCCIPLVNIYLIYLLAQRGDKMDNHYGIAQEA